MRRLTNIFRSKQPSPQVADAQLAPCDIAFPEKSGARGKVKVDLACRLAGRLVVAGWCTGSAELGLHSNGGSLNTRERRVSRPDVSAHFNLPEATALGFVLVADHAGTEPVSLAWRNGGADSHKSRPLTFEAHDLLPPADLGALGTAVDVLAELLPPHSEGWSKFVTRAPVLTSPCSGAKGFLEAAECFEETKDSVVVGWVVHSAETIVWLEDDAGRTYPLDGAFKIFRQDVYDAVAQEFAHASSHECGFLIRFPGLQAGGKVRLKALTGNAVYLLGESACTRMPADPVAAARRLFAIETPSSESARRGAMIDGPLLAPLLERRQTTWRKAPIRMKRLGAVIDDPRASIIIPLYGRADFVEHQLIEFAADAWFSQHAELIYVLDDPKLVDSFSSQAEALYRTYGVPFTWMWGSSNRGFSGANNLGASHARGAHLVFLNSDAFPQQQGWVEPLLEVLRSNPEIGAVAPRLVFANGAIQHAGMEFKRLEEWGVWINHHPQMGLDPSLDRHRQLALVPAVTGACIAMRRADFDRVAGWDEGYLIGDFEDSDLCMKLRKEGLRAAYLPDVQLTHLERQSFRLLGQDAFRTRVTIFNAVRHQQRWGAQIESELATFQ